MWRKSTLDSSHYAIKAVRDYAIAAHGDQKYGDDPYVVHLDEVAEIVRRYGTTAVKLAYLHDILEDTSVTFDELALAFGTHNAQAVFGITMPSNGSRKEKLIRMYFRADMLKDLPVYSSAFIIKTADRLANVRHCVKRKSSLLKRYKSEHEQFHRIFYVPGLCEGIWAELDDLFAQSAPKV